MSAAHKLRLDDQLCFALYAAYNAMTRAYRPLLQALGLTYPQYLVLIVLWEHGERTPGFIARQLELSPNAVTPLIDRLVVMRLAERRRDRNDGRSFTVLLTVKGAALELNASEAQSAVADRTQLGRSRFDSLRRKLRKLSYTLNIDPR